MKRIAVLLTGPALIAATLTLAAAHAQARDVRIGS